MFYSHFSDSNILSSDQVLMTVLKKKERYYLMAEGIVDEKPFIKILTQYKNYFLTVSEKNLSKYKVLTISENFSISTDQFKAIVKQKLWLNQDVVYFLRCHLNEQQKKLAVEQLKNSISQKDVEINKSLNFKKKKRDYLKLTAIEAIRKSLDWATISLLILWIPISFFDLAITTLIILIAATLVITIAVAAYSIWQQYQSDKNELKKLTKNLINELLELPQKHDLTYLKDFILPLCITASALFSFFWVTSDMLIVLGVISSVPTFIIPLIVIPICLLVSVVFAGFHFWKLNLENQLYEEAWNEKNNDLPWLLVNSQKLEVNNVSTPVLFLSSLNRNNVEGTDKSSLSNQNLTYKATQ